MKKIFLILLPLMLLGETISIYDFKVKTIDGEVTDLKKYENRVMLIVNVASECGFTPQYAGLQKLYEKYESKGLSILGFPCNQFLHQEPKSNQEIKVFCVGTYSVSFDMFSKIEVNGDNTHPLYAFLKKEAGGFWGFNSIKWNFTKFLVSKEGKVIERYSPSTKPKEIEKDIIKLLEK